MENLTGGTPPVRYLPCVVSCKLYFTAVIIICLVIYFYAVSRSSTIKKTGDLRPSDAEKNRAMLDKLNKIKLVALIVLILTAIVTMIL